MTRTTNIMTNSPIIMTTGSTICPSTITMRCWFVLTVIIVLIVTTYYLTTAAAAVMMDTFKIIQQIFHTRCISLYGLSQVITTYLVTSRSVLIFASTTICPLAPTSVDVHVSHDFFHNTTNTKPIVTTRITTSSSTFINLLTLIEFSFVTSPRFQTLTITLTVLYKVLSLASFVDSVIEQFFRVSVALIVGELYQ